MSKFQFSNVKIAKILNFRFEKLLNFRFEKSHSQQKHLSGLNYGKAAFLKAHGIKSKSFDWRLTFYKSKSI
jgi:hypothetical protein